jgi:hypothetical protein
MQLEDTCKGEVHRKQHKEMLQQVTKLIASSTKHAAANVLGDCK